MMNTYNKLLKTFLIEGYNKENYNLTKEFKKWNKTFFNNELILNFPLKYRNTSNPLASVKITLHKPELNQEITEMFITDKFKFDNYDQFAGIFVHELIHVKLAQNDILERRGKKYMAHGAMFMEELRRINSMNIINVPKTENVEDLTVDSIDKLKKPVYFIILVKPGEKSSIRFFKSMDGFDVQFHKNFLDAMIERGYKIFTGETFNSQVTKYPISRSAKTAKGGFYEFDGYDYLKDDFKREIK